MKLILACPRCRRSDQTEVRLDGLEARCGCGEVWDPGPSVFRRNGTLASGSKAEANR